MSRADYAHWNEEQDIVWWQEEGKHYDDSPEDHGVGGGDPDDEDWRDEPEPDPDEDDYRTEWLRDDYEYDRAKESGELP